MLINYLINCSLCCYSITRFDDKVWAEDMFDFSSTDGLGSNLDQDSAGASSPSTCDDVTAANSSSNNNPSSSSLPLPLSLSLPMPPVPMHIPLPVLPTALSAAGSRNHQLLGSSSRDVDALTPPSSSSSANALVGGHQSSLIADSAQLHQHVQQLQHQRTPVVAHRRLGPAAPARAAAAAPWLAAAGPFAVVANASGNYVESSFTPLFPWNLLLCLFFLLQSGIWIRINFVFFFCRICRSQKSPRFIFVISKTISHVHSVNNCKIPRGWQNHSKFH